MASCFVLCWIWWHHFHSCLVLYHSCRKWQFISTKNTLVITVSVIMYIFNINDQPLLLVRVFLAETCQFQYEWYSNKQVCKWKPVSLYYCKQYLSTFWNFAMFWMLYSFFWVIPWHLNLIRQQSVPKLWRIKFRCQGSPKRKNTIFVYFASVCRPM